MKKICSDYYYFFKYVRRPNIYDTVYRPRLLIQPFQYTLKKKCIYITKWSIWETQVIFNPFSAGIDFRRQILTSQVYPRTEKATYL